MLQNVKWSGWNTRNFPSDRKANIHATSNMHPKQTNDSESTPIYSLDSDMSGTYHGDSINRNEQIMKNANIAKEFQQHLSIVQAIKYYTFSIFWSSIMSLTIIMEAYDTSLISSFFAFPSFCKKYGKEIKQGTFELESHWQVSLSCAASIGLITGVILSGYLTEKYGHRKVTIITLIFMSLFVSIQFFASNVQTLVVGQVLCGVPWGIFGIIGTTYSSEIMPLRLRGYLTAYTNVCYAIGQLMASGLLMKFVNYNSEWSYRIPFAMQWVFPVPLIILIYLAPESPWWLVRHGYEQDALNSIKRLTCSDIHHMSYPTVCMIIHTNRMEEETFKDVKDWDLYKEIFSEANWRRTKIAAIIFSGQVFCGSSFSISPSYFFRETGLSPSQTYNLNFMVNLISLFGSTFCWGLLSRYGRRDIYIYGFLILSICLLLIGIMQYPSNIYPYLIWVQCFFVTLWVGTYYLTIGPVTYTIVSEISATKLRAQTVAVARGWYHITQMLANIAELYMINPTSANLKGYTGLVWFVTSLMCLIWSFRELPETKDRPYDELDILFDRGVPARDFSTYDLSRLVDI